MGNYGRRHRAPEPAAVAPALRLPCIPSFGRGDLVRCHPADSEPRRAAAGPGTCGICGLARPVVGGHDRGCRRWVRVGVAHA